MVALNDAYDSLYGVLSSDKDVKYVKFLINSTVFASGPEVQPTLFFVRDFCLVAGSPPLLIVLFPLPKCVMSYNTLEIA